MFLWLVATAVLLLLFILFTDKYINPGSSSQIDCEVYMFLSVVRCYCCTTATIYSFYKQSHFST